MIDVSVIAAVCITGGVLLGKLIRSRSRKRPVSIQEKNRAALYRLCQRFLRGEKTWTLFRTIVRNASVTLGAAKVAEAAGVPTERVFDWTSGRVMAGAEIEVECYEHFNTVVAIMWLAQ